MDEEQRHKAHKGTSKGAKATNKINVQKLKKGIDVEPNRGKNPKAFGGVTSGSHKARQAARAFEKRENILHVPEVDKTLASIMEEPPLLVAVVGPPGCGKTTLIRSMVKFYSNRNLQKLAGPVTIVAGRSRRITFLECPNTLTGMCDIAKISDLILLMVDGNFGFEMETFEFLNIAQVHGFPRIIGLVSHLDKLKTNKALKKRKKFIRHRFWHEVVDGAKMLCLSPMHGSMYRGTDVIKLHQLLICVQPKIQLWRTTHSCMLADRHEDITDPDMVAQEPDMSRTLAMYGYIRGKPMKAGQMIHVPGLGDFPILHISHQNDPCSFDDIKKGNSQGHKMRHLSTKQKRLYAPYSDVGGIMYDEDAIYIQEDTERENIDRVGEGVQLMRDLQKVREGETMDERNYGADMAVVEGGAKSSKKYRYNNDEDGDDDDDDETGYDENEEDEMRAVHRANPHRRPMVLQGDTLDMDFTDKNVQKPRDFNTNGYTFEGEDEEDDDDNEDDERVWNTLANEKDDADLDNYGDMPTAIPTGSANPSKKSYYDDLIGGDEEMEEVNTFNGYLQPYELAPRLPNDADGTRVTKCHYDWTNETLLARVKNLFVTGAWKKSDGGYGHADDEDDVKEALEKNVNDDAFETKGYDSDDEEFQQLIKGEKSRKDEVEGGSAHQIIPSLNGDVFGTSESASYTKPANKKKNASKGGDDDDSDYDILADNDVGEGTSFATEDPELRGLVEHFISYDMEQKGEGFTSNDTELGGAAACDDDSEDENKTSQGKGSSKNALSGDKAANGGVDDEYIKKRMAKKQAFDDGYDVDGGKNATTGYYRHLQDIKGQKEKDIHEALKMVGEDLEKKVALVGYFSGLYVRIVVENVPMEFSKMFDPKVPLLVGGLNAGEDQMQIVHAKIKRHRWYPRILKAQDPIMISMGWRRFQTQPIFAAEDPNGRLRYLKYTPLHMHCYCAFYAPVTPANTGFVTIPVAEKKSPGFRLTSTGYTIGNDNCTQVVKKLKLTGVPEKIMRTTVFIKGMFNSDIEAAKFVGAKVKAVSGLRGIIKAVPKGKNGLVRCTFEDKLLKSDIVFMRTWKGVDPPRYCAMAPTLLQPNWVGMRPMAQLRRDYNIANTAETNPDSQYGEVKKRRNIDVDEPVHVLLSRNTRKKLPFNLMEEYVSLEGTSEKKRMVMAATTVAPGPNEMKRTALLDTFRDKANQIDHVRQTNKLEKAKKAARESKTDDEEHIRQLKKAKKETAKKQEFRTQHKSKK